MVDQPTSMSLRRRQGVRACSTVSRQYDEPRATTRGRPRLSLDSSASGGVRVRYCPSHGVRATRRPGCCVSRTGRTRALADSYAGVRPRTGTGASLNTWHACECDRRRLAPSPGSHATPPRKPAVFEAPALRGAARRDRRHRPRSSGPPRPRRGRTSTRSSTIADRTTSNERSRLLVVRSSPSWRHGLAARAHEIEGRWSRETRPAKFLCNGRPLERQRPMETTSSRTGP